MESSEKSMVSSAQDAGREALLPGYILEEVYDMTEQQPSSFLLLLVVEDADDDVDDESRLGRRSILRTPSFNRARKTSKEEDALPDRPTSERRGPGRELSSLSPNVG